MISRIVALGQGLWYGAESAIERVERWFRTRRWEQAPCAIPACLVGTVLLLIVLGQRSRSAVAVAEPYRQALRAALDGRDYRRAELVLRKLTDLNAADDRSRLQVALLARSLGKSDEALRQIEWMSPKFKVGFPLSSDAWHGTVAAEDGYWAAAREHLERACRKDSENPALLNNLAWVLANGDPPELQRALELADSAVSRLPDNGEIRETRGQILLRMRKSEAAAEDLQRALSGIKPQSLPAVQAALAEARSQLASRPSKK